MMNDVRNITAIIDFSKKENKIVLVIVDKTQYIEARDVEAGENVLAMMEVEVQEYLGDLLTESSLMNQYRNDKLYQLGYEMGKSLWKIKLRKIVNLVSQY